MRISCEQCHAVFTIDDSLIKTQGIRAECPRCGVQKTIHAEKPPEEKTASIANPFAAYSSAEKDSNAETLEKTSIINNPFASPSQANSSPLGFDGPLGFGGEKSAEKNDYQVDQQTQSIDLSNLSDGNFDHNFNSDGSDPAQKTDDGIINNHAPPSGANPFQMTPANSPPLPSKQPFRVASHKYTKQRKSF